MPVNRKNARDVTQLTGKPLAETLSPSSLLQTPEDSWVTSPDLKENGLAFAPETIYDLAVFMLGNPNMNSSILFRADILFDSMSVLSTPRETEDSFAATGNSSEVKMGVDAAAGAEGEVVEPLPARTIAGFELTRTVVRRFIPRNPQLDRPLEQSCYFYEADEVLGGGARNKQLLVVYTPHVNSKEELPWYHPVLRSLAYFYDFTYNGTSTEAQTQTQTEAQGTGAMSIHFLPYPAEPMHNRLERTLLFLLNTQIRLARGTRPAKSADGSNYNPTKDNVIPRHLIQNTYSRLKIKHANWLCDNWAEDTEPSKHVFEDLAITAFLIELWRSMYGAVPADEREDKKDQDGYDTRFPGFVDVACGNGVLVYVLLLEGYHGWGFDARNRKTWKIFPEFVKERLKETIYIPKPFADELIASGEESELNDIGVETHTGMFSDNTFIISNHADELTVWTPLMAALSSPSSPLPFLAIPCCSHSLSGAKYRYPAPKKEKAKDKRSEPQANEQNPQPANGDLKALRAAKQEAQTDAGMYKSMYGCLTAKAMSMGEDIGYDMERTLLRIPSTRNMGVIGGRKQTTQQWSLKFTHNKPGDGETAQALNTLGDNAEADAIIEKVWEVVQRECSREGGVRSAAKIWIERAKGLNKGQSKSSGGH
ncbi:hypothetical protein ASPWEDRAFT_179797 [Aspergillus wentii DTO 134E9]|uniref:tRNA (uracil-O(2)-)-methyltransferase n=1 Tax=Aspergillus wentii DTO 134E9 TaxID=1073089 RepID=A0A1L9RTF3_ASPWE|nr:uncharacterized protein ASPWEDRAFT_179797 [Aspergillus wentii DTO 134E9]OJJ38209.1 hypothetical protein ASPWEDRAFT_179797 [Aspergillus wentii DTO 134E9]